jgi:hypothetical protein
MNKKWAYILLSVFFAMIILTIVAALFFFLPNTNNEDIPLAVVDVIEAPTSTPFMLATFEPTPTGTSTINGGDFHGLQVGGYAQISGTSGDGLSIRNGPGTSFAINFVGLDSELFKIVDGPNEADGYVWWKVEAPYDSARNGWCVQDYLSVINSPEE